MTELRRNLDDAIGLLHNDGFGDAEDAVREAASLVDRLPVYEDTGKPFVPGVHRAWTTFDDSLQAWPLVPLWHGGDVQRWDGPCYSTAAAACEAAHRQQDAANG